MYLELTIRSLDEALLGVCGVIRRAEWAALVVARVRMVSPADDVTGLVCTDLL